jgi:hypothetical protein
MQTSNLGGLEMKSLKNISRARSTIMKKIPILKNSLT